MKYSGDSEGLKKFIKETLGDNVSERTVFFKDLKLIGDDADTFIQNFSEAFKIDMTEFKFDEYFIDEYNTPFLYWYDVIFRKEKIKRKEFDIRHLKEIIEKKKWINT